MKNHHPLKVYTNLLRHNNQFSRDKLNTQKAGIIASWYLKILAMEPFRITERVLLRNRSETKPTHAPIFILGHWRSGTSILQTLLSQDPQFGYLNKFASVFPEAFVYFEDIIKPVIHRITRSFETKNEIDEVSVSWDWDTPGELDIAMTTMFSPYSPHWGHVFPITAGTEYFDKFFLFDTATPEEIEGWKQTYKHLIQKLSYDQNGKQLIIKSPGNTARIPQLLDLYPDAKFIYIHRNPFNVFYSNIKMWRVVLDNFAHEQIDTEQLKQYILYIYKQLLSRYLESRERIPSGNLVEVRFEDFVEDPIHNLQTIYRSLGLNGFTRALAPFRAFIDQQLENGGSNYAYKAADLHRINKEWDFSLIEWPYERPLKKVAAE